MARFNYNPNAFLTIDEALDRTFFQLQRDPNDPTYLGIVNTSNGPFKNHVVELAGNSFSYDANGVPTGGNVNAIRASLNGVHLINVDLRFDNADPGSLVAFWQGFIAGGSVAGLSALLSAEDVTVGTETDNKVAAYGPGDILIGMGGNDTFVIHEGANNVFVSGTDTQGGGGETEIDTIEMHGSATLKNLLSIDVLRFADTGTVAKTAKISGNSFFGVKAVQGSASGVDELYITGGSESVNIDLSGVVFTNWTRATQTVRIELNTDTGVPLDNRVVGSAVSERMSAGNGQDLLYGNFGDDALFGEEGNDRLEGGADRDTLHGGAGQDVALGGTGNDRVNGDADNDLLYGGAGNDILSAGVGNDWLYGEAGKDVFVFDTKLNKRTNVDKIHDFRVKDDSIHLENAVFTKLGSGSISKPKKFKSDMFVEGKKAQDREDRIVYDKKTGALYYDQDGTGGAAQVKIATLPKNLKMTAADFYVI